jgi:hypothetical protein
LHVLESYVDVFAWHKGELECCLIREHDIDTQGLPPCHTTPNKLSYWEEAKVNRQIQLLVKLRKIRINFSKYACKVALQVKKDGNMRFCGDYHPLNMRMHWDAYPMPLIDDILNQMGST